jgi:DNA (cytosine-5)-methyltransferase 1
MSKVLRALDLYCGAGGATRGLQNAGFHVTGVDIVASPRYCGDVFIQSDVMRMWPAEMQEFDFIWASPPCQAHSSLKGMHNAKQHRSLIEETRARLIASDRPHVIENVVGAPLINPIALDGSMFGLGAQGCRLERRRLFETSFPITAPKAFADNRPVIGVYGGHARRRAASAGGRGTRDIWEGGHKAAASQALGIDWMSLQEMSQAIPPVYASYIAWSWRVRAGV